MRVVSGKWKGRQLKAVPGMNTRPTTDKVKEAVFNIIGPYFDGGLALDLFGGSGSLGIEAISRGMDKAIFVDKDGKAIQTIKQNVENFNIAEQVEIYRNDALRALNAIKKREIQFDLILLDPPYKKHQLEELIHKISEYNLLNQSGIIMAEHSNEVILPDDIGDFIRTRVETYGITVISVYQNREESKGEY
ncbi:16S rRNA (guanine(966)-N(2))-methyltransferase RsmD [Sutcliffiella rhizosphaerae]|uniref:Ribosomal RNA small subunit methyltransferase D n=1 Tax=Sutcliffiella rhizosphaerae TaxID=2880967 RepID=A0ABM8YIX6_9BACI|nr:16S rRNA (guanine(966)-N(2))-methyltransferase RsmD [Sutcliffiella rhizosphaerae]CAG9619830.1 Ribosomal RNA small subunit methyltransferase D [Sutcliffiella rhizosphaerae]